MVESPEMRSFRVFCVCMSPRGYGMCIFIRSRALSDLFQLEDTGNVRLIPENGTGDESSVVIPPKKAGYGMPRPPAGGLFPII